MKRSFVFILILFAVGFLLIVLGQPFYVVPEGTQVIITRFGEPVGKPITEAGLQFKAPFIDVVNRFEKRLLEWDGDPNQIPTKDKRFIWIDTTARWKIVDPLKFLQSVGDERGAQARLDDILDAEVRDVVTEQPLIEIVRSSNREFSETLLAEKQELSQLTRLEIAKKGRQALTREILKRAQLHMPRYGIELIDMRIKRINYIDEVREKIYDRMIAERRRAAEKFRSEGEGRRAEIEGRTERDLKKISSEAYRKAQVVKGKADAEATAIYAKSFGQDADFYDFVKTLDTYKASIDSNSTLILTTDSDYFKYLKGINPSKK